jgi:hypothetical protein
MDLTGDNNGLIEPGNIDLHSRPRVRNADGSISTVRSMSFNMDGQEVLVPTVSDDGRIMGDDEAVDTYRRTGRHLGKFSRPDAADAYAQQLHIDQEREYAGTEGSMADDSEAATIAKRASAMVKAKGAKESADNLNRASLAIARGEEATDFTDMLDGATRGVARPPKPRAKPAGPGGEHTPQQPMANSPTTNKPPETPKAGDGPGPRTNVNPQQNATTSETYRGDGTIQTPLTVDRKASRTQSVPDYDAMGNPTGTQTVQTSGSPAYAKPPAPPTPQAPIEQYVDRMVQESTPEEPMAVPGPQSLPLADRTGTNYTPPPGSVAPVQSNPAAAATVVQTPQAEQPAVADGAQRPQSFQDYLASKGGSRQFVEDFLRRPETGLLMGGRGLNVGAGLAGGARGAATAMRGLPAPPAPAVRGNPNMAAPPDTIPMGGGGLPPGSVRPPGPAQLGGPAPQQALPSSYGPPMSAAPPQFGPTLRGNPNSVPPMEPIPLQAGNQAMRMPGPVPPPAAVSAALRAPRAKSSSGSRRTGKPKQQAAE